MFPDKDLKQTQGVDPEKYAGDEEDSQKAREQSNNYIQDVNRGTGKDQSVSSTEQRGTGSSEE